MKLYQLLWAIGWRSGVILCVVLIGELLVDLHVPGWVGIVPGLACGGIGGWWYLQVANRAPTSWGR